MTDPIPLNPQHSQLIRKLESIAVLGDEDRHGLFGLPMRDERGGLGDHEPAVSARGRVRFTCTQRRSAGRRHLGAHGVSGEHRSL
jgi:hypothetical protein